MSWGGAVLAAGLVAKGLDVIVLEAGSSYGRKDFDGDEAKMPGTNSACWCG